ncbi:unnamed protein product [Heterobilharzia americana]|nr:unnamed protein product [Heterobilharzia americana]
MTSLNCFKIRDTNDTVIHPIRINNSHEIIYQPTVSIDINNNEGNQIENSTISVTTTITTTVTTVNCQESQLNSQGVDQKVDVSTSYTSYSHGNNHPVRCKPHFRYASLSSSTFGTCMPTNKRDNNNISSSNSSNSNTNNKEKAFTLSSTGVQISRNCFGHYPNRIRKHIESNVSKHESPSSTIYYPVQSNTEIIYTTSINGSSTSNSSGLVRSQSDSTCLSLKAITGDENYFDIENQQTGRQLNLVHERTNDNSNYEISKKSTSLSPSLLFSLSTSLSTQTNRTEEKEGVIGKIDNLEDDRRNRDDVLDSIMQNSTIESTLNTGLMPEIINICLSTATTTTTQREGIKLKCLTTPNNSLSTPTTPSRSYQLICRNGVQSYALVTEKSNTLSISPENIDYIDRNSEMSTCHHGNATTITTTTITTQSSNCCPSNIVNLDRLCNDRQSVYPDNLVNQHHPDTVISGCLPISYEPLNYSGVENTQSSIDTHILPIHQYHGSSPQNNIVTTSLNPVISTLKACSSHPIVLDEIYTSNTINASHSSQCHPFYSDPLDILNSNTCIHTNNNNNNSTGVVCKKSIGSHSEYTDRYCQVSQISAIETLSTGSFNPTDKPTAPLPSRKQRPLSPSTSIISVPSGITTPVSIINMHQLNTNMNSIVHQLQQQKQPYTPKLSHHNVVMSIGDPSIQSLTSSSSSSSSRSHYQHAYQHQNMHKLTSGWSSSSSSGGVAGGARITCTTTTTTTTTTTNSNNNTNKSDCYPIINSDQFTIGTSGDGIKNYYSNNYTRSNNVSNAISTTINSHLSSIGFMNNDNSGGSNDLTISNSPRRSPRVNNTNHLVTPSTVEPVYNAAVSATSTGGGLQACVSVHCSSNLLLKSSSTSIPTTTITGNVDSILLNKSSLSSRINTVVEVMVDDPANEMTISELRSIAERQRQQLARQAQQLQAREERRAWLRSLNSQRSALNRCVENEKLSNKPSDLSQEQEIRLHKLRGFRGQTEQVRLSNENLMKEIDQLALLLSNKEHDLQVCDKEQMKLNTMNQTGTTTSTPANEMSSSSSPPPPLSLPFMQPPFFTELDKKRWHDGLVEADRLDRQFAAVFGRKPPIQTWSSSQSNLHFGNIHIPEKKSTSSHVPCSIGSVSVPSVLPPSYSLYHQAYSKSRSTDQSSNVHTGCSSPSTPIVSRTMVTNITTTTTTTTTGTSNTFSSLLTRANSPPTSSRRSCLRTFMQLHPGFSILSSNITMTTNNNNYTSSKDSIISSGTIHPLPIPRIKAPPRYASRAVINDTYMRRICRDSVEKYKRTASEIYLASVNKLGIKSSSPLPLLQSSIPITSSLLLSSSSEWSNDSAISEPKQSSNITSTVLNESIMKNIESVNRSSHEMFTTQQQQQQQQDLSITNPSSRYHLNTSSGIDAITNDNNKTLNIVHQKFYQLVLIGIDIQPDDEQKLSLSPNEFDSPEDDQKQQNSGDVDSGLGGSDHTIKSEQQEIKKATSILQLTTPKTTTTTEAILVNTTTVPNHSVIKHNESKVKDISPGTVLYVNEGHGTGIITHLILMKNNRSSLFCSNSVRFHPLALLLDAALEGDLELVRKAAAEVKDVSESNDEGITALHNAVCAGRVDVAEFLVLTAGADVNAGDTDGWTPLHCAASCGNLPLAKLLVEHGASLHARTLSDQETPLEKCDQGDEEAECEEYLYYQNERLGSAASGRVYALFPRGIDSAGPGSIDSHLEVDELPIKPNELLTIINREPPGEIEWMLAENSNGQKGLVPRSHISCYPLVRIPLASLPIMEMPKNVSMKSIIWNEFDDDEEEEEGEEEEQKKKNDDGDNNRMRDDGTDTRGDHHKAIEYQGFNDKQLLPERISKLQSISPSDNLIDNNNNNNHSYAHVSVDIEDISSVKPQVSSSLSSSLEAKQYISRPSIDFTGLKTDDRQSSDEMDSTSSTKVSKSETCDLETSF